MFIKKNKYYLIIESIKDLDLKNIKLKNKYAIIYRANKINDNFELLSKFRSLCRVKKVEFYVANNINLLINLKADGLYISAKNKNLNLNRLKIANYKIIGSVHNIKELRLKKLQGCTNFVFSRLFKTNYENKKGFLGIIKFNLFKKMHKEKLIPLGGINSNNINQLNIVNSDSFSFLSEIKKKPAKIFSRLF